MLGVLSQLFQSRMSTLLAPFDLTYTQMAVLSHLMRSDDAQSVSQLANVMQIQQPGMTKVVKRLQDEALVSAEPDPADPRRKLVCIAAGGQSLLADVEAALFTDLARWFEGWPPSELSAFVSHGWRLVEWFDAARW